MSAHHVYEAWTIADFERQHASLKKLPSGYLMPGVTRAELLRLNAFARMLIEELGCRTLGEAHALLEKLKRQKARATQAN